MKFNYKSFDFKIKAYKNLNYYTYFGLQVNNGDWKRFPSKGSLLLYIERAKNLIDRRKAL